MAYRVFQGTTGNDRYVGNAAADYAAGFQGDDEFFGRGGDDNLNGGLGNDILEGGTGNDLLDGGEGIDAAVYRHASAGVIASLEAGTAQDGDGGTDTLRGIEVLVGSAFDDIFRGSAGDDDLRGGAGDDQLFGLAGDDILRGDEGADTLWGCDGVDFADYYYTKGGVVVDLAAGTAVTKNMGTDTLHNIEGVMGSRNSDRLTGDGAGNDLRGFAGNDILIGGGGVDVLYGDTGRDTLIGGEGLDYLFGGQDADLFKFVENDLGATRDTADQIADFSHGQGDRIVLNDIDANTLIARNNAFTFVGNAAFSGAAGELRYEIADGFTTVQGDIDGDGIGDGYLVLVGEHALVSADFIL